MVRGKVVGLEAREIIYKVYLYFVSEARQFKGEDGYFQRIQLRVSNATGVSMKFLYRLLKEKTEALGQPSPSNEVAIQEKKAKITKAQHGSGKRKIKNPTNNTETNKSVEIKEESMEIDIIEHDIEEQIKNIQQIKPTTETKCIKKPQSNSILETMLKFKGNNLTIRPKPIEEITAKNPKPITNLTMATTAPEIPKITIQKSKGKKDLLKVSVQKPEMMTKSRPVLKLYPVPFSAVPMEVLQITRAPKANNINPGSTLTLTNLEVKVVPVEFDV